MGQPKERHCAIWMDTATFTAAQELAELAGVDVDSFMTFVVKELHEREAREGALREQGAAPVLPINEGPATTGDAVVKDRDDDALAPAAGMVVGMLASLLIWAVLITAVLAAYQSPSVTAMVQTVLLAARRAVS
jgi:hypothetical protein